MEQYIPWAISGASLLIAFLTYNRNGKKAEQGELDSIHEGLLKANMKLDQVCSVTNETRTDIKGMQKRITDVEKEVAVVQRDIKTAFNLIDQLKGGQ